MGVKLLQYYKYVNEVSGLSGKIKLAQTTKVPSTQAAIVPDTPDHITAFKKAVETITGKAAPNY
jgi:hypothetical protein